MPKLPQALVSCQIDKIYNNKKGDKSNRGLDYFQQRLLAWALRAHSGPAVGEREYRTPRLVFRNRKRLLPAWKLLVGLADCSEFQGTPDQPSIITIWKEPSFQTILDRGFSSRVPAFC